MARRPFRTPEALVVVSTDGYFDVYSHARRLNDKPSYRGLISELGSSVRGADGTLSVRPDSVALDAAVAVWSREQGAAAVRGDLGLGRTTGHDAPTRPAAKSAAASAEASGGKSSARSDGKAKAPTGGTSTASSEAAS